jgi:hypothetical protein
VHRDPRFAEQRSGVPQARIWRILREDGLDEVVAVPADAVDTQARQLPVGEAAVELGGGASGLLFPGELVA